MNRIAISMFFLGGLCGVSSCQRDITHSANSSNVKEADVVSEETSQNEILIDIARINRGYQSFAFYEGIPADGKRSLSRSDGTDHGMPCISRAFIEKGEEQKYNFWHGHDGELHRFTITAEDFALLRSGKSIEIFTAVVDGHKHAVKIDLDKTCSVSPTN